MIQSYHDCLAYTLLGYFIMSWAEALKKAAIKKKNTPRDLSTLGTSVIDDEGLPHHASALS